MNLSNVFAVTFTGPSGPGLTVTAGVYNNVYQIDFNWVGLIVQLYILGNPNPIQLSLSGVTTVTTSVSGKTIAIS